MYKVKKGIKALVVVLILFMCMNNIRALGTDIENDLKYIPNMEVEKLIDDHNIILPTKPTRAASGSVVEKIIKNSSGIMTGKEFRVDGKLVETVYYNYLGNNAYQLCKRNLYHSDGKTIERTRLYNKSEWITNTKRFTEKGIIDWTTDYDGTSNKYPTVSSKYEETGKFWIYTNYYNKGNLSSKDYRPGLAPNHISHTGFYEVTGTNWTKAQYYYTNANPTDKSKIDKVILYLGHASPNNFKTYETKYRNDGTRDYYIRYEEKNNNRDYLTYYNTAGKVIKTVSYYKGNSNREWETIYNDKDTKASAKKYSNTSGKLIDDVVFQDNGIVDHRTYYNDEGIKIRTLSHYKNSNSVEWETFYKENGFKEKANRYSNGTNKLIDEIIYQEQNKVDVRTYFSEDSKTLRKIRYFKDGEHLRWDINYENGLKKNVQLYNLDFDFVSNYFYSDNDLLIDSEFNEKSEFYEDETYDEFYQKIDNIFDDAYLKKYICELTNLNKNDLLFIEDLLQIEELKIDNTNELNNSNYNNLSDELYEEIINNNINSNVLSNVEGIGFLRNLRTIDIKNTNLLELPSELGKLDKLTNISTPDNKIESIGEEVYKASSIEYINLENNNYSNTSFGTKGLNNLKELNLRGNKINYLSKNLIDLKNNHSLCKVLITKDKFQINDLDFEDLSILNNLHLFFDGDDEYYELNSYEEVKIPKDIIETNDVNRDFISDAYFKIAQSNNNQRNVVKGTINFTKISDNPDSSAISTLRTVNNVDSINKDMINEPGTYRISTEVEKNNITICNTLVVRVYDNDLLNELNNELGTSNTEKAIPNDYIELSNEPSIANQNINEFTNNKLTSEISNALSEEVYLSLEEKNDISAFIEMNVVPKKQRGIKSIAIRKAIRKLKGFISKKGEKWWKSKVLNKIKKLPFKNKYINKIEKWINFKNILKILARCDSIYSYIRNVVASTLYSWHWHWLIVEPISWAVEATVWYFF